MSELEAARTQPEPGALIEYQLVRMNGAVIVQFVSTLNQAMMWLPEPGFAPQGPCAGRYRLLPDGPWIVRAYYPDGYPGRQAPWPEDAGLPGARLEIPAAQVQAIQE